MLDHALYCSNGKKGVRSPYYPVAMFNVSISTAQNNVANARMVYLIGGRLSWVRFLSFGLGVPTPDVNTIRKSLQKLTSAGTLRVLFDVFDHRLHTNGYVAMAIRRTQDQIVDAALVAAHRLRNMQEEKDATKASKTAGEVWTCNGLVPVTSFHHATLTSKSKGLMLLRYEWRRLTL